MSGNDFSGYFGRSFLAGSELFEGNRTMDNVGERRRANRRSCVENERDAGLEVARKWTEEDDKHRALLRIARAVEEARREIDVQTLQHLIDPEHRMDAGDWVRFWEDRGFSGDSEPSDVSDRAFADAAAGLSRKSEPNCNSKPVPWDEAAPSRALGRADATRSGSLDPLAQWLAPRGPFTAAPT